MKKEIVNGGGKVWNLCTYWNSTDEGPRDGLILRVHTKSASDTSRILAENKDFTRVNRTQIYIYIAQKKFINIKNVHLSLPQKVQDITIQFEAFRSVREVDVKLFIEEVNNVISKTMYKESRLKAQNSLNALIGKALRGANVFKIFNLRKALLELQFNKNFLNRYSIYFNSDFKGVLKRHRKVESKIGIFHDYAKFYKGNYLINLDFIEEAQSNRDCIFFIIPSEGAIQGDFSWSDNYGYYFYAGEKVGSHQVQFSLSDDADVLIGAYYGKTIGIEKLPNINIEKDFINKDISGWYPKWLDKNIHSNSKSILIYGDLNMNAVDGSSIWAASFCSAVSKLADVKVYFLLKNNISRDILLAEFDTVPNIQLIQPYEVDIPSVDMNNISEIVEKLDSIFGFDLVVCRGREASEELSKVRRLYNRLAIYLTDIYIVDESGFSIPDEYVNSLNRMKKNAKAFFVQTNEIEELILDCIDDVECFNLPPMLPNVLPERNAVQNNTLKIIYAGKFAPMWGIAELFNLVDELWDKGVSVQLHLVGDKIHKDPSNAQFHIDVKNYLEEPKPYVVWHGAQSREKTLDISTEMNFAWAYRSGILEDNTLEISTKLLEYISIGIPTIVYRNSINEKVLGKDYPFFVSGQDLTAEVERLFSLRPFVSEELIYKIKSNYSMRAASETVEKLVERPSQKKNIVIASHDFKFIAEYESHLIQLGFSVRRDYWNWGEIANENLSRKLLDWGDIFICEWSLANAAWYSNNISHNKQLFVRLHAQEVRARAQKFSTNVQIDRINKVIFVADHILDRANKLWNWPDNKVEVIPNYVFNPGSQYLKGKNAKLTKEVNLGVLGGIPMLKRIDRAIDLLELLPSMHPDINFKLSIKGRLPKDLPGMYGNGARQEEQNFYNEIFSRIEASPFLKKVVTFEAWSETVSDWYSDIDIILSPSDDESFHYALADGVMYGCLPAVWAREGVYSAFPKEWVGNTTQEVMELISDYLSSNNLDEVRRSHFNRIVSLYDSEVIFKKLDENLLS